MVSFPTITWQLSRCLFCREVVDYAVDFTDFVVGIAEYDFSEFISFLKAN